MALRKARKLLNKAIQLDPLTHGMDLEVSTKGQTGLWNLRRIHTLSKFQGPGMAFRFRWPEAAAGGQGGHTLGS